MFDFIYSFIGKILSFFNSITGSYIFALLLFAIVAKMIFIPFDIKQQKNSIKQASIRPKEMALRNKYKGRTDRATQMKLQQEIQDLYQREGYSPFGGCLPMLLQFPIIIILYGVIRQPITYIAGMGQDAVKAMAETLNGLFPEISTKFTDSDQISMIAQIKDLTADQIASFSSSISATVEGFDFGAFVESLPNFELFGINFGYAPSTFGFFHVLIAIPVLNFAVQFISTKIMKKFQPQPIGQDPSSQGSMKILEFTFPLMTFYFAYVMSAAIGIYWIFQNIISLFERFIIAKLMPLPVYTEEQIKEMEKAAKAASKSRTTSTTAREPGEKPRSLHRIDEDDDDEPAPAPKKKSEIAPEGVTEKKTPTEQEKKNAAIADKMIGEAPALKDESDKYNAKNKK